jgi:7-carboxy-7-deazaguanine synthase
MRIAEIFYSIQGEGKLVGVPSVFVRTSGCNLRCTWCDTPYASWHPEGIDMTVEQIAAVVASHPTPYVVLTGGEPMMFKELPLLIETLKQRDCHITIETAGTLWLPALPVGGIDLASISPKLSNSIPLTREGGRFAQAHERQRIDLEVLRTFATGGKPKAPGSAGGALGDSGPPDALTGAVIKDCQWKFVLATPADLAEMQQLLATVNTGLPPAHQIQPRDILLMPEGTDTATITDRSRTLAELCKLHGYRLSPRLHVYLYGNTKGT